jgi:hypothetical protein
MTTSLLDRQVKPVNASPTDFNSLLIYELITGKCAYFQSMTNKAPTNDTTAVLSLDLTL